MVRVVKLQGKAYWAELSKRVKASSFTEGVFKSMKRYRRDKLIWEQEERGRDEAPTIIRSPRKRSRRLTSQRPLRAAPDARNAETLTRHREALAAASLPKHGERQAGAETFDRHLASREHVFAARPPFGGVGCVERPQQRAMQFVCVTDKSGLDNDGDLDLDDVSFFMQLFTGPF